MEKIRETLLQAVEEAKIPHGLVAITNTDGSFTYSTCVGKAKYPDEHPIEEDAVLLQASSSKLVTTIATLQCIEKGLIGLDDDVSPHLPELAKRKILQGFDEEDHPILAESKVAITPRHLLTHSAGTTYDALAPGLGKLRVQQGRPASGGSTLMERFGDLPLMYEPGSSWAYSAGIDWAGRLVERLSHMTLEQYMQEHIFQPLGITSFTFWPYENADLRNKIPQLTTRTPDGQLAAFDQPFLNTGLVDCLGGQGLYGPMLEYRKILHSILADDGRLLKPEMRATMFQPQLSAEAKKALRAFVGTPAGAAFIGEWNREWDVDWGLGGILLMQDGDGRRKKGTLSWGGIANTFWLIDPSADLALTCGTQVIPPGDPGVEEVITVIEKATYRQMGVKF